MKRRPYILTYEQGPDALALPGDVLAISPAAFGRAYLPTDARLEADPSAGTEPGMVAVVHVCGPLAQRSFDSVFGSIDGYDAIAARFDAALKHPQVGAVVLLIDSPGGDVAGCFEAVRRMSEARDRAGKPVFAYADEMIASAAYAIATVATAGIYAPRSGDVGSVGVLAIHSDGSAADEKDGVKFTVVRSGARKAEGNPLEPLTDAARGAMQTRVDELALQFFELVAEGRGLTVDAVRALEGAMFSGQQAVAMGLANGVASLEEVLIKAGSAVSGVPMTDEEKKEMDALKAENEALKAKLADADEGEEESAEATDEEDTSEGESEEEEPKKKPVPAAANATADKLKAELVAQDVKDVVDAAGRAGKVEPAGRAALFEEGLRIGAAALAARVEGLAPKVATKGSGKSAATAPGRPVVTLSAEDRSVAKQLGIPEDQFAAQKAASLKETL